MGPMLTDDVWKRRGVSLLWDAENLATVCRPTEVVSLRQFLQLHRAQAAEDAYEPLLVNDGQTMVVAGLEAAIDALEPEAAEAWLCEVVYPAILEFQQTIGSTEGALVLWLADARRLRHESSDDTHYWYCATAYQGRELPLSRCLFNGAHTDRQYIRAVRNRPEHAGLYMQRVS
jgi:hypothetical protein